MNDHLPPPGLINGKAPLLTSFLACRAEIKARVETIRLTHQRGGISQSQLDEHNHLVDVLTGRVPR